MWNKKHSGSAFVLNCPLMIKNQWTAFQNKMPTIPTMHQPLKDFSGGNSAHYMQLILEPKKTLYDFFHICTSAPQDL